MNFLTTEAEVGDLARSLEGVELFAADTEAAGYHRYHDRVCLLQISTREETHIIDTLAVQKLGELGRLLSDRAVETVFHDADYDLRLLDRDFGISVRGIFDTKVAAQFLGEPAFGLASLAEKFLGIIVEKKHQRADWAQRPLPADMLAYAAQDTRLLPDLRDRLKDALREAGRLTWAEEEFLLSETARWDGSGDGDAYLRVKNTRDLKPRQLAALRELYQWRERVAEERDVAPFRVVTNEVLVHIARGLPLDVVAMQSIQGVPGSIVDRHGSAFMEALARAQQVPTDLLPTRPRGPARPQHDAAFEARVEKLKGARDRAADQLGIDRGFLMPKAQLEELARRMPKTEAEMAEIPGIRRWQVEATWLELAAVLKP
jgi:ribonuclease D